MQQSWDTVVCTSLDITTIYCDVKSRDYHDVQNVYGDIEILII